MLKEELVYSIRAKYPDLIITEDALESYICFCLDNSREREKFKTELHHILPASLFPEYSNLKKFPWNGVNLLTKDHFLAHYMLANAINDNKVLVALRLMARVFSTIGPEDSDELSILYAEYRERIAIAISEQNTGWCPDEATRAKMSKNMQGTAYYRKADGSSEKNVRLRTDSKEVASGEYIHYRIGHKHKEETKQKISDNGIRGRTAYHKDDLLIYLADGEGIPEGFSLGLPEWGNVANRERPKDKLFIHNPTTGEGKRILAGEVLPEGFVRGRRNFGQNGNPFENHKVAKNLITGESTLVETNLPYPRYYANPACKYFVKYGNYLGISDSIAEIAGHQIGFVTLCINKPGGKVSKKTKYGDISEKHYGDLYSSFGFSKVYKEDILNNPELYDKLTWLG